MMKDEIPEWLVVPALMRVGSGMQRNAARWDPYVWRTIRFRRRRNIQPLLQRGERIAFRASPLLAVIFDGWVIYARLRVVRRP